MLEKHLNFRWRLQLVVDFMPFILDIIIVSSWCLSVSKFCTFIVLYENCQISLTYLLSSRFITLTRYWALLRALTGQQPSTTKEIGSTDNTSSYHDMDG